MEKLLLNWRHINDEDFLPDAHGEVLALGYQSNLLIGYCHKEPDGSWTCEDESTQLQNVTHFVPVEEVIANALGIVDFRKG